MPVYSDRRHRRAFTLVELLVVIAVLGVLAAILIPVVAKVRSSAQSTHCVSNLQQIGRAFTLYAHDNRGCLPAPVDPLTDTTWFEAIHAYAGKPWDPATEVHLQLASVFTCPTWARNDHTPTRLDVGYAMSAALGLTSDPTRRISISSVQQPTRSVLLLEAPTGTGMPFFPQSGNLETFGPAYTTQFGAEGCDRHDGASNYLFVDGHVGHHTSTEAANFLP